MNNISKLQNFDLNGFLEKKNRIYDKISLINFERLSEYVKADNNKIELTVFATETNSRSFLNLEISTILSLKCYKCLEKFDKGFDIKASYEVVKSIIDNNSHFIEDIKIQLNDDFCLSILWKMKYYLRYQLLQNMNMVVFNLKKEKKWLFNKIKNLHLEETCVALMMD